MLCMKSYLSEKFRFQMPLNALKLIKFNFILLIKLCIILFLKKCVITFDRYYNFLLICVWSEHETQDWNLIHLHSYCLTTE